MNVKNRFEKPRKYREIYWGVFILFMILVSSLCLYNCASGEALEVLVYPPKYLIPGTETALRVIVLERNTGQPVPDAQVTVRLRKEKAAQPELLLEGKTNSHGTPGITLKIPQDIEGEYQLMVEAQSQSGNGKVSIPIIAKKEFRIFLTTDKAVYRPGQTIHMRGLVFEKSKAAANQEVSIEVLEPSGYSVLNKTVKTCDYGIAEADFTLGNEIKTGDYTLRFFIGDFHDTAPSPGEESNPTQTVCAAYRLVQSSPRGDKVEKKVHVIDVPPPTFNVEGQTEKTWYVPGQEIKGNIKAADFLGKPLNRGKVNVILYKNQKEESQRITDLQGITDASGVFAFSYPLPLEPDVPLNKQSSHRLYRLVLEAAVQDEDRVETINYSLPISRYPIVIQLVPESGEPKIGLENTIYVVTTYPDGRPAACTVSLKNWQDGNPKNPRDYPMIHTDLQGVGEFKISISPQHHDDQLHLAARDRHGNRGEHLWRFPIDKNKKENVILKADQPVYNSGETPTLTITSTQPQGVVYVDVHKENQIILTKESKLEGGKASIELPMAGKHTGILTCHARIVPGQKTRGDSPVLADWRKIIILPEKEEKIELALQSSKKKYFPGEEANIEILTSQKGQPCAVALGITIVEDSMAAVPPTARDCGKENRQLSKVLLAAQSPLLYRPETSPKPFFTQQTRSHRVLYTNPRLITDQNGRASFNVRLEEVESPPVSQWRVLALAHTSNGEMASGIHHLPVNRGPLVEMELPPQLTQEDEIAVPVTVYNYQPSSQEVELQLRKDDWFELSGPPARNTTVRAHDKKMEYFKIRVTGSGNHQMKLDTRFPGSDRHDTLSQAVTVKSLGRKIEHVVNFNLKGKGEISQQLQVPAAAIQGSYKAKLKILPAFINQVADGFQGMLRMPYGCFEQSSSFTYPNIMILDYMQRTGQDNPGIRKKAENYISDGYQKLLQFEAKQGGFSFFRVAGAPQEVFSGTVYRSNAQRILTAYGLMLFTDMGKVYQIDRTIIPRIQQWLISQMNDDHWGADSHFGAASSARNNDFAATGYITWALLHSGIDKDDKGIKKAIAYLGKNHTSYGDNPNALSYCALAMINAKENAAPVIQRLNQLVKNDKNGTYWTPATYVTGGFASASVANIETTAIAALANLENNNNSLNIVKIIHYLLKHKSALGNWGSTQATILTLKVLIKALPQWSKPSFGNVRVWMDDNLVKEIAFNEENNEIKQVVDFKDFIDTGNLELKIKHQVSGALFCQLLSSYYVKWDEFSQTQSPINLTLIYDNTRLNRGETVTIDATASYIDKDKGTVPFAIVDIGIPPGFAVNPEDFRNLRDKRLIDRFEMDNGRIILYLSNLGQKGFRFGMKALNQGRVKMPEAIIYDYYNPQVIHVAQPVELTVN
jgi:5-hydroxyisourate hydrolase-like protein (transthyretin family)